jgi:hypothetical protein
MNKMAFRTFGSTFAVASTVIPQPLVGSWVTAGLDGPAKNPITLTLGTATSSGNDAANIFRPGDQAWLINAGGTNPEPVLISSVLNNTLILGQQNVGAVVGGINPVTIYQHASGGIGTGTFILLQMNFNNIYVTLEDGATGQWLYLGNAWNMTATSHRISKLAKVAANVMPYFYSASESSPANPFSSSELWTLGTTVADTYNVSLCVV